MLDIYGTIQMLWIIIIITACYQYGMSLMSKKICYCYLHDFWWHQQSPCWLLPSDTVQQVASQTAPSSTKTVDHLSGPRAWRQHSLIGWAPQPSPRRGSPTDTLASGEQRGSGSGRCRACRPWTGRQARPESGIWINNVTNVSILPNNPLMPSKQTTTTIDPFLLTITYSTIHFFPRESRPCNEPFH